MKGGGVGGQFADVHPARFSSDWQSLTNVPAEFFCIVGGSSLDHVLKPTTPSTANGHITANGWQTGAKGGGGFGTG